MNLILASQSVLDFTLATPSAEWRFQIYRESRGRNLSPGFSIDSEAMFEALGLDEAKRLAAGWGFELEGELTEEFNRPQSVSITPEAFDVPNACRIMGDISRSTLYRLLMRGKLERLPATRKILVTRRSIERFCSQAM